MHPPRHLLKRMRRAFRKLRRAWSTAVGAGDETVRAATVALRPWSRAAPARWEQQRRVRLMRDLASLRAFLAGRPELRLPITCTGRIDGAGGQALSIFSALAFAHNHRCRYLHTPFRLVDHVEGDAEQWTRAWETFLGLGRGEAAIPADAEIVPLSAFVRLCRRGSGYVPGPRMVVQAPSFGYAEMAKSKTLCHLKPLLRTKYLDGDKSAMSVLRTDGAINVAVHVRRGDVGPDDRRYTADAPILATIAEARAVIAATGQAATIHLFSEGKPEQFLPYSAAGCVLHLSTDPFEAFHSLVIADVLVTTDSAFSRAAAMISGGIVITPNRKWGLADRWLVRTPEGMFDREKLAALLAAGRDGEERRRQIPLASR
jgi:hypothetical protein